MADVKEKRQYHLPVLAEKVIDFLAQKGAVLIDGTVGDGGHALRLLKQGGEEAKLLGLDLDLASLVRARERLAPYASRAQLVHETFANIADISKDKGFRQVTGIIFDLGMSSHHLADERGFSFHSSGTLDMRYDPSCKVELPPPEHQALKRLYRRRKCYTAADVINSLQAKELADIIQKYGEERFARRIAREVVKERKKQKIDTPKTLVRVIKNAVPPPARHGRIHLATRTFQALRIAVNREFESLSLGIEGALEVLTEGGRLAVISFHSGEDRIAKHMFREAAKQKNCEILTKKPIRPTAAEVKNNPLSSSAKLRVIEKYKNQ